MVKIGLWAWSKVYSRSFSILWSTWALDVGGTGILARGLPIVCRLSDLGGRLPECSHLNAWPSWFQSLVRLSAVVKLHSGQIDELHSKRSEEDGQDYRGGGVDGGIDVSFSAVGADVDVEE
jgi:hypothetical protein